MFALSNAEKSAMSFPDPPTKVSCPLPAIKVSSPFPPIKRLFPPPPSSISLPKPPMIVSSPNEPRMWSLKSVPVVPVTTLFVKLLLLNSPILLGLIGSGSVVSNGPSSRL